MAAPKATLEVSTAQLELILGRADENTKSFDLKARSGRNLAIPPAMFVLNEAVDSQWSLLELNALAKTAVFFTLSFLFAAIASFAYALDPRTDAPELRGHPHVAKADDRFTWWGRFVGDGWNTVPQDWLDKAAMCDLFDTNLTQVRNTANINAVKVRAIKRGTSFTYLALVATAFVIALS